MLRSTSGIWRRAGCIARDANHMRFYAPVSQLDFVLHSGPARSAFHRQIGTQKAVAGSPRITFEQHLAAAPAEECIGRKKSEGSRRARDEWAISTHDHSLQQSATRERYSF